MKKTLALFLALIICFTFCACGGKGKTVTEADVTAALEKCEGTLNVVKDGDKVTSFTYLLENLDGDLLADKREFKNAIVLLLNGNGSKLTYGEFKTTYAFTAAMAIHSLLDDSDDDSFDADAYTDKLLDVICNGATITLGNWKIYAKTDVGAETVTFHAES